MALTVFFSSGRSQEFSTATAAQSADGQFYIGQDNDVTGGIDVIATLPSVDVVVAQVYRHGTLVEVIAGDGGRW